jgi:hypothetical protein
MAWYWWLLGAVVLAGKSKSTTTPAATLSTPTAAGSAAAQQPFIAPTPSGAPDTGAGSADVFNPWASGAKLGGGAPVTSPVQNTIVAPAVYNSPGTTAAALVPSAGGVDKLIMSSPNGSQIWQRPNGSTYELWASTPAAQGSADISSLGPPPVPGTIDTSAGRGTDFLRPLMVQQVDPVAEPMIPINPPESVIDTVLLPADNSGGFIAVSQRSGVSTGVNQ